jgi:hypothetical protein
MQQESAPLGDGPPSLDGFLARSCRSDSSLHPNIDSASDNETSEKPVREKLEKASIAAVPGESMMYSEGDSSSDSVIDDGNIVEYASAPKSPERTLPVVRHPEDPTSEHRGRVERKRSSEHLGVEGHYLARTGEADGGTKYNSTRKRSRELFHSNPEDDRRVEVRSKTPGLDDEECKLDHAAATISSETRYAINASESLPMSEKGSEDLGMTPSIFGLRKKRSRDQLDADVDREQKIVATEEAKAQRRSEENERDAPETTAAIIADVEKRPDSRGVKFEEKGLERMGHSDIPQVVTTALF